MPLGTVSGGSGLCGFGKGIDVSTSEPVRNIFVHVQLGTVARAQPYSIRIASAHWVSCGPDVDVRSGNRILQNEPRYIARGTASASQHSRISIDAATCSRPTGSAKFCPKNAAPPPPVNKSQS